jgi:hypothetical protein
MHSVVVFESQIIHYSGLQVFANDGSAAIRLKIRNRAGSDLAMTSHRTFAWRDSISTPVDVDCVQPVTKSLDHWLNLFPRAS